MSVDYKEYCRRIGICRECPFFKDGFVERCGKCNCPLLMRLKFSDCPMGKF